MRGVVSRGILIALGLACLLLPSPAAAQEDMGEPVLWISYVTAEPGKSGELGGHMASEGGKIYDGLVADGHVISWGIAQAINHYPGDDWTHLEFINFRDWAAVGEFVNRFMADMQAKSPDQMAQDAAKWAELTVHGSHYDEIGRHRHLASDGGRPSYISLSTFSTQPGQGGDEVKSIYEKWRAPVMDALMNDGKINAHGFYTSEMHGPQGWADITAWYTMPGLAAVDAVDAASEAAEAARSEAQQAEWLADVQKVFVMPDQGNHSDRILLVTHYHAASPPSE